MRQRDTNEVERNPRPIRLRATQKGSPALTRTFGPEPGPVLEPFLYHANLCCATKGSQWVDWHEGALESIDAGPIMLQLRHLD